MLYESGACSSTVWFIALLFRTILLPRKKGPNFPVTSRPFIFCLLLVFPGISLTHFLGWELSPQPAHDTHKAQDENACSSQHPPPHQSCPFSPVPGSLLTFPDCTSPKSSLLLLNSVAVQTSSTYQYILILVYRCFYEHVLYCCLYSKIGESSLTCTESAGSARFKLHEERSVPIPNTVPDIH